MTRSSRHARRHLDERFERLRPLLAERRPQHGWVRALRDALGMSSTELARRMGVTQSAVPKLERSEAAGSVKFDSLFRAAEALDCDLVYFLVPRRPLEHMVRDRAQAKAAQHLAPVAHHSRLEDQSVTAEDRQAQLDELADRFIDMRGLWTDEEE